MEMTLEVMMWMLDMEVDKVAKFLTNASGATWWSNLKLIQVALFETLTFFHVHVDEMQKYCFKKYCSSDL